MPEQIFIEEGNKLIAEFMGGQWLEWYNEFDEKCIGMSIIESIFPSEKLEYHSSWDWLMPVVEKINKWHQETICKKFDFYLLNQSICSSKAMVWQGCIEFIQWYNNPDKT